MQVAKNFDLREFVSQDTYNKWGNRALWFVDQKCITLAQFCKDFFTDYYIASDVEKVTVTLNDYLFGGNKVGRGYREPKQYVQGQFSHSPLSESLHRQGKAIDMVITVHYKNGSTLQVPTKVLLEIIHAHWDAFKQTGVTAAENHNDAPTWLHMDFRNTQTDELLIVRG